MATIDQLMGGQGGGVQPLRPTTLPDPFASLRAEQFKIREQERFIDEVGLNTKPRVSGAPAVYDFEERDKKYEKDKLAFAKQSAFRQWSYQRIYGGGG